MIIYIINELKSAIIFNFSVVLLSSRLENRKNGQNVHAMYAILEIFCVYW